MARAPIDYTLDVINPIQAAMQGYSFGLQEKQAERDEERSVERFGMEKKRFGMAQQTFDAQQRAASASAAQQGSAAKRKEAYFADFSKVVNGEMTRKELIAKYPDYASTMKATFDLIPNEVADARVRMSKQLQAAINNDRPDLAVTILDSQIAAANNSNQPDYANQLTEMKRQLEQSPKLVFEQIGILLETNGDESAEWAPEDQSALKSSDTIGGIASVQIMEDGTTQIVDTRTNQIVIGAAATKLLNDARKLNEKPLSGIGKLAYDLTNENITQDQFDDAVKNLEPSPLVTISQTQEDAFASEAGKQDAKFFSELNALYAPAARKIAQIDRLQDLLSNVETGGGAYVKNVLGRYGIKTEGLDAIQAVSAYIEQLIPGQREPGSGSSSDIDVQGFRRGLPSLINQPGGNEIIVNTIRSIQEHEIAVSLIGGKVMDGQLTRSEGRKALNELVHPLAEFNAPTTTPLPSEIVDGAQLDFSTMSVKELGQVDVMTLSQADLIAMNARYTELRTSK